MAKQIFDNQVDNSVVRLSHDEKNNLRQQFEEARMQLSANLPKNEVLGTQGGSSVIPPPKGSFFKTLWNFILSMLMNIPFKDTANISMSRIKEIRKHMGNLGVDFYNFKSGGINADFAFYLLEIYRGVFPVYLFFHNPQNESFYENYLNAFFENLMEDSAKQALALLSQDALEKMFYDESIADKREALNKRLKDFTDSFKGNTLKNIQTALIPLEQMAVFYQEFDFQSFFSLFGKFENHKLSVSFQQIDSEKVLPFLKSLGALCKMITEQDLNSLAQKALEIANKKMAAKGFQDASHQLPIEQINKGLMMIRKLIKLDIIDSMLQYITLNEKEISGFLRFKKALLNRYQTLITQNTTKIFNEMEEQKSREFLIRHIHEFFGIRTEGDLDFHPIYNNEIKRYLSTQDIKSFEHLKPLCILNSFFKKYFDTHIREVVNTIVVKGNFIKKQEGEEFSACYYQLDDSIQKLSSLLHSEMTPSERIKNPVLEMLVSKKELTPVEKKTVKEKLGQYDYQIQNYIEKIVDLFFDLFQFLEEIKGDWGKKHPSVLANLKNLSGIRHMSFMAALEESMGQLETFFNIIGNFIVIKHKFNAEMKKIEKIGL